MPLRPTRPPDLDRVSAILAAGRGRGEHPDPGTDPGSGWVPRAPEGARRLVGEAAARVRAATAAPDEVGRLDADLRRARRPGLLTTPDEVREGRRGVSSAAAVALLALVVAVGCAFVVRVLWAERSSSVPGSPVAPGRGVATVSLVPAAGPGRADGSVPTSGAGVPRTAPNAPTASVPSGVPAPAPTVVVHVVGQVARPGLVRLPAGSRVADAVEAAGGARRGADLGALNLARLVVDGEQVHVPRPGEPVSAVGGGSPSGGGGPAGGASPGAPVNLNTADLAGLDALPGVGPVLAQRILDWRAEHGRFTSVDELGEVSGIGDALLGRLRPQVTL